MYNIRSRTIDSCTPIQDVVENSESTQWTLVPSAHKKYDLAPSPSPPVLQMSLYHRELFKYPLPPKRNLLTCHQAQKSQVYHNTQSMSHAQSIFIQCTEKIKHPLHPQGTLGHSVLKGEAPKCSTYTSEMLQFPKTEQDSLSSTISNKETVGQETPTKGYLPTATSLEMACGCETCTKDVLPHISSVDKVMDPTICEPRSGGTRYANISVGSILI